MNLRSERHISEKVFHFTKRTLGPLGLGGMAEPLDGLWTHGRAGQMWVLSEAVHPWESWADVGDVCA